MRSSALIGVALAGALGGALAGCSTPQAKALCYPVTGWASPEIRCAASAPAPEPAPVAVAPPPPEPPKPEPEPEPPPPPPPPKAALKSEKIELSETVEFETDSAVLTDRGRLLLDDVARELTDHPEVKKIQIEGHTDAVASNKHNMKLSQDRVASVRKYLLSKGVDAKRLSSKAFGETKPIASNKTEEGRTKNRRVEFRVLQRK